MMLAALAFVLAQAAPSTTPHQAPQTDDTVAVQRGTRLAITNLAGEVVIHGWDKDSVHITARHQPRMHVAIHNATSALTISASGSMGPAGSVDYDISAPSWMNVRVEGTYDFITIEGMHGEIFANTVRGDVSVKGGSGFITAKSVDGTVKVDGARGKLVVSAVREDITVKDSTGEISADAVNGGISLTGVNATSVDATSINGTIVYEGSIADGGHYSFESHNGDLLLGLAESPNATFNVRTYQGSFSTEFGPSPRPDAWERGRRMTLTTGNGSADITLESFGGAIRIRHGEAGQTHGRRRDRGQAEGL
jgi:DUF4097 and DUF4098 domain-containing protein YvlB